MHALKRLPKRTDKGEPGKRAARTCTKPTSGHNLAFFDTGSFARVRPRTTRPNDFTRTTRPNDFARTPSNDSPKRSDKGEPGKRAARTCTKPTSGHNLAFFDTGSFARVRPRPTRLNEFTRTTRPNEFARTPSNDSPKRTDKGDTGKRAARTCTKPTSGHNLAFFDTGSFARARPRPTRLNEFTSTTRPNEFRRAPSNDSPKRSDKGEPGKRAARTCTKPTLGHNLAFFDTGAPSADLPKRFHRHALK